MKKAILPVVLLIVGIAVVSTTFAQNATSSVESVLGEIKQSQNVVKNQDIKCDSIADEQFSKLGDALMSVMHPNENEHELMDQMMGGENSNSLKSMHTLIAKRYLSCLDGSYYGNNYGMMGGMMGGMYGYANSGMMNNWNGWNWMNMMGNYGIVGLILMILFWILIILGAIYLLKFMFGRRDSGIDEKSALEILKERYAKGEINKEEYEAKKKDLQ